MLYRDRLSWDVPSFCPPSALPGMYTGRLALQLPPRARRKQRSILKRSVEEVFKAEMNET